MTDRDRCVEFLQQLIRTESPPGGEEEVAGLVRDEMEELGYDEVRVDDAGNVLGLVAGRGEAPTVTFNTHLDHVDAGDPEAWEHPPFGGEVHDGRVWGRGAADIKGPLAAQVHGAGRLAGGDPPAGDVWVTATVQEEVGGLGARHLAERRDLGLVVVGEPSQNELRRGHRGRVELQVRVRGRSAHASAPERGANPLRVMGRFLTDLETLDHPVSPDLGPSTLVPTRLSTDQESANVIPGEARLTLDCRTVPGQSAESVRERLEPLLERSLVLGTEGEVAIPRFDRVSYTGMRMTMPADNPAFVLPEDHPAVRSAVETLTPHFDGDVPVDLWTFATDGGHFARAGGTVIGLGPGEESLAHTVEESIAVEELERALDLNETMAREWPVAMEATAAGTDGEEAPEQETVPGG
ncbi:MAG: M20/M25/M40 family metallo-hydrolase [Candidatus Palauibacterales bacterium]|nr:M20/M25/M40 family metallo-hydrolase [Candidatus Palauibacterales bacterium]